MKRAAVLVLIGLVPLWAVIVACGGAPTVSSSPTASTWPATNYTNHEYGFAIKYPAAFAKVEVPSSGKSGDPLFQVFFVDPSGTKVAGKSVDLLEVAVYQMSGTPKPTGFKKHKADFENMLAELIGKLPGLRPATPVAWTTVAGQPAVTETYTYTTSGEDAAVSAELVFKGDSAYLVRAQASRATWPSTGRKLVSAMGTFSFL